MKTLLITLAFCLVFVPHILYAQNQAITSEMPKKDSAVCSNQLIDEAEFSFKKRFFSSKAAGLAERKLATVLKECPQLSVQSKIKEHLLIVREEMADRIFRVALYYLTRFQEGKIKSPIGCCSRLIQISNRFPEYSEIDKVHSLLKNSDCSKLKPFVQ